MLLAVGELSGLRGVLVVVPGRVGRIDEHLIPVKLQQVVAVAAGPVGELLDVGAGKGVFADVVLQLVHLLLRGFCLHFRLVEIEPQALVQHHLQKAQQQKARQTRQDDEPGELLRQTVFFRRCHCCPPVPQSDSPCPRRYRCAEGSEGSAPPSSAGCGCAP